MAALGAKPVCGASNLIELATLPKTAAVVETLVVTVAEVQQAAVEKAVAARAVLTAV